MGSTASWHRRHVDTVLLKQAQAFISHVLVGEGCVLLQGPKGPERQFCGIYNSNTVGFHPGLIVFHIPCSSAFSPCRVLGCPVFLATCVLGQAMRGEDCKIPSPEKYIECWRKRRWAEEENLCGEMALLVWLQVNARESASWVFIFFLC